MEKNLRFVMEKIKNLFFIGIGGISMSSLAFACKKAGYKVAGSDRDASAMTKKLSDGKIPVYIGHDAKNIDGYDAVVYTGAIADDNPELIAAKEKDLPIIYRADLLGWLMRKFRHRIGVAGMHGKSTATSMMAHIFIAAGTDPTVMSGAETREMGGAYRTGKSRENFIFEACEYKDSFLDMFPSISVLLNIDVDHTDYFSGIEQIKASFEKFAQIPFLTGAEEPIVIACGDDEKTLDIAARSPRDVTFGIDNPNCDYLATKITEKRGFYSFEIIKDGEPEGKVSLKVPGYHNIYNALAAFAAADVCGISCEKICSALSDFEGTLRRFEYKGSRDGVEVYIDYAHHPREISAVISTAKKVAAGGKVIALFEPHTYSRTAEHFDAFASALSEADNVILLDIYAARETNTFGVSSAQLADAIPGACYAPSYESAASIATTFADDGDLILILGAGTIYKIADLIV